MRAQQGRLCKNLRVASPPLLWPPWLTRRTQPESGLPGDDQRETDHGAKPVSGHAAESLREAGADDVGWEHDDGAPEPPARLRQTFCPGGRREPCTGDHAGSRRRLQERDQRAPALATRGDDVEESIRRRAVSIVTAQVVVGAHEALSRAIDDDHGAPFAPRQSQRGDEGRPVSTPTHGHHDCACAGAGGGSSARFSQEDVARSDELQGGRRRRDWFGRRRRCSDRQERPDEEINHVRIVGDEADKALTWTRGAADINFENLIESADSNLLRRFGAEFERLWNLA